MVKELMLYCRLGQMGHDKMGFLIARFLESAKFRCSFTLVIKCLEDIPMYVKFVSHKQVNSRQHLKNYLSSGVKASLVLIVALS